MIISAKYQKLNFSSPVSPFIINFKKNGIEIVKHNLKKKNSKLKLIFILLSVKIPFISSKVEEIFIVFLLIFDSLSGEDRIVGKD